MQNFVAGLPDTEALRTGLELALQAENPSRGSVALLTREPTAYSTTFPCEIVTCRIGRGRPRQLFCKYTADIDYTGHGHRGGVSYEIKTYRNILTATNNFRPRFYGAYTQPETGQYWLFLEYLKGSIRVGKLNDLDAMAKTARWIARFHTASLRLLNDDRLGFLKRYDKEYFLGWIYRAADFAGPKYHRSSWLQHLCDHAGDLLSPLMAFAPVIIHGEYYQHNILFHQGQVCPVDWESAAIAEGLIDLASLTDGWESKVAGLCAETYAQTRWPVAIPAEFPKVFQAAKLYMAIRWLGDDPDFTGSAAADGHWAKLQSLSEDAERTWEQRGISVRRLDP